MNRLLSFVLLFTVIFAGCKSTEKTSAAKKVNAASSTMTDVQRAEVTNIFFNASKEKILGNLDNAATIYSEVIRRDPNNAASMYELANIYADQKKFADALFFSKSAYNIDKKNTWYALIYSDILQKNKRFGEAATVLQKLVQDYPNNSDYYYEWANALIFDEKIADAVKVYDKLEQQIGITSDVSIRKARLYQRMKKNDKAIEELKKLIANDPRDPQSYGMLAEVYQAMGEKEKALETYNMILKVDPENPYVHLSLADYYRNIGEKDKSVEELKKAFLNKELDIEMKISILSSYYALISIHPELKEQALEISQLLITSHPNEPRAHAVYGDFLNQDKKYADARASYKKARELGSNDFSVISQVLFIDAQLLMWDSLMKDSQEAISLFPDQPTSYFFNGMANIQKKNYSEAVISLNSGVKMVVDNKNLEAQFYTSLGDAYNELKNYPKSDENYEKALALDPKNPNVLNNYAYYLSVRVEQLDKAERMSRESNELEPKQASYQDTYGWIMYKQNKFDDAKLWIEKSLSNDADSSATVLEHYGDVLFKIGDTTRAIEFWLKAKSKGDGASDFLDRKILEKKIFE
jgi:tetratricopeptide (TPR) repeat protein